MNINLVDFYKICIYVKDVLLMYTFNLICIYYTYVIIKLQYYILMIR